MILVDRNGHLASTGGPDELHAFARRLGLSRSWYQEQKPDGRPRRIPHYDLTSRRKWNASIAAGARLVAPKALVRAAWRPRGKA